MTGLEAEGVAAAVDSELVVAAEVVEAEVVDDEATATF